MRGCAWCLRLVPAYADSPDFCRESCQRRWTAQRAVPLGGYESDDEMLAPGVVPGRVWSAAVERGDVVDVQISRSWVDRILGRRRA